MAAFRTGSRWVVLTVVCGLVAGCVLQRRPPISEIEKARADSLEGTSIDSRRVNSSIFFVITTPQPIGWQSVRDRGPQWLKGLEDALQNSDPLRTSFGLAFSVDPDGYLLTAGHCLIKGSYTYLLGWIDGKAVAFEPRVVAKITRSEAGAEYALLAVPRKFDVWLKPGPLPLPDETVVAVSRLVDPVGANFERGTVVTVNRHDDEPKLAIIETTLPLWHGDSGAPLMTTDGRVVGVNIGGYRGIRLNGKVFAGGRWRGQGLACAPSWSEIERRIRNDEPARRKAAVDDHTSTDMPNLDAANLFLLRMGPRGAGR